MLKKSLATAISLAISSPIYADDISFYAGGAFLDSNLENEFRSVPANSFSGSKSDDSATALKIFGGARMKFDQGFYGAEIAYEDGNSKTTTKLFPSNPSPDGTRGTLEDNSSFSLSLTGGYNLSQYTYLTGRVGYISTKFDYKTYEFANTAADSGDETLSGVQLAVGVEHNFTDTLGLRVEYSTTDYSGDIGPVNVDRSTGALAEYDEFTRDAISIGIFANF